MHSSHHSSENDYLASNTFSRWTVVIVNKAYFGCCTEVTSEEFIV